MEKSRIDERIHKLARLLQQVTLEEDAARTARDHAKAKLRECWESKIAVKNRLDELRELSAETPPAD